MYLGEAAFAAINQQVNFQGKVVNTDGTNVANASYNFLFCIYTTATPATPCTALANNDAIWRESKSITTGDSIFQTNLGDTTALPGSVDFNSANIYLGVNFNGNGQMSPLIRFTASPYSFNSLKLNGNDWATPAGIGTTTANTGAFTTLTSTGNTTLASIAGSTLGLGNTTGAITINSGGASSWTNTSGGLSFSTTTSGNISLSSSGGATGNIQIGSGGAGTATPDFFGLDVKSTTGDPAGGFEGAMYYNTLDNKFRCYQGTAWTDCIGSGLSNPMTTAGDIIYGGTAGAPTRLGGSAGFLTSTGAAAPTWTSAVTDYFTQYALLAGRIGGQILTGGTAANNLLTIRGNSAASGNTLTSVNLSFNVGNSGATNAMSILNNGNVGIGTAAPGQSLEVNGNIKIGSATTGTIVSTGELVMREDGDTYGSSILRLRNRTGENGAIFETNDVTATLVDFIFKTAVNQRNIRMESRVAYAKTGANSFQIGGATLAGAADPDNPTLSVGDNYAAFKNRLAIGSYNLPTSLLDIAAPTIDSASLRLIASAGINPTTPNIGEMWFNGTNLYFRKNGTTSQDLLALPSVTLQNAYDITNGNTIITSNGRDVAFTLAELTTPTTVSIENQDTAGTTAENIINSIASGTLASGLSIENTGAGTMTNAISILESAGTVATGINIGNGVTTGISIGTGSTTGISIGSGGITISAGGETINGGALAINNTSGITSNQATLIINASGTVDIQDIMNADSITSDTGGVTIAAGQTYGGVGAVTVSSTTNGLTLDSGNNTLTIAASDTALSATGITTMTLGSGVSITNGSGNINLQPAGNATTANVQIGAGGAGSVTPDLLALDVKNTAGDPTAVKGAMYFNSNTNKFRCSQDGISFVDCISSSSVAGANTQIQFNDGGTFGGDTGFTFDKTTQTFAMNGTDAEILLNGITNEPTAPAAGDLLLYSKSIAGRMVPKWKAPSGVDTSFQASLGFNRIATVTPASGAVLTTCVSAYATGFTNVGTVANPTPTGTNAITSTRRTTFATAAGVGSLASHRQATTQVWRGNNVSGAPGGFFYTIRFGTSTTVANSRFFVGMADSIVAPTNVDPTTSNTYGKLGMAINVNTGNWNFVNNITGTAPTVTGLGGNFPVNTTDLYELVIYAKPNDTVINYRVTNITTGNSVTGVTGTTNIPSATTFLAPMFWTSNGTSGGASTIDFGGWYLESDQ